MGRLGGFEDLPKENLLRESFRGGGRRHRHGIGWLAGVQDKLVADVESVVEGGTGIVNECDAAAAALGANEWTRGQLLLMAKTNSSLTGYHALYPRRSFRPLPRSEGTRTIASLSPHIYI